MSERRYRLLARAQLDGEVREPGYVFKLAEGERGPHKTVVATIASGMAWRHFGPPDLPQWDPPRDDLMRDEPLYEEIKGDE